MPNWMEKYRDCFNNTGGNTVEELQNCKSTLDDNAIMAFLAVSMHAQVGLIETLKDRGLLK